MIRFLPWLLCTLLALFSTPTTFSDVVEVKLLLDGSDLGSGKTLYAFDANTNAYLSVSKNTNSSSIATFDLPAGQDVKFRYTFNGKQFFSDPVTSPSTLSSSNPAILNLPAYTDVQLLIGGASAGAGKVIYAFNDAGQYISYSRNTDSSGLSRFTIDPALNPLVKFRYSFNGRQWFSSVVNTTSQTALVVPTNTDVTLSQTGTPFGANQTLYAFRASTGAYLNYSRKTNASGVASFTLAPEEGPYKFRYTYNGKQWFTDPVPFANPASLDLPPDSYVQATLGGTPVGSGKVIYAFEGEVGGAYLGYSRTTDSSGIAKFTLPIDGDDADTDPDSYKFRYDYSGVQHFSPSVPSGASTSISIAVDTKVQLILAGSPAPSGKVVYAFEVTQDAQTGDEILTYTNLSKTTDASGEASFSLGSGSYKFRHDLGGKQWFSSLVAQGGTAILTTPSPTYVSVNIGGTPAGSGKVVYAFNGDGSAYHNYSRNTNSSSVAEFYLEDGEYSFRYDYGGKQWFSDPITVPNTYQAQVLVPVDTTVTVLEAGVPVSSKTVYAFDSAGVYQNYTKVTDSNGVASFTLDSGDYKFRYSKGGKDWFSNVVSQGGSAVLTVPAPTYISLNVGGTPGVSKTIYVFGTDNVYHNYSRVTDASGVAKFYLTPGQYLFRYSFGGQDWFTDPVTVTESGASDTLIVPVKTQISLLQAGNPIGSGKTVYAFNENGVYLNYSRVTDANSIAEFSLDAGTYKFRYDFNGRQFFSDLVSVSGSGTASAINLPPDTNVTLSQAGTPLGAGKTIYAFSHSDVYQNYSRVTDSNSVATFTLPISTEPYKFRYDYAARQFFSPSVPSGAAVTLNVANDLVVTVYQGSTPLADTGEVGQTITKTLYLFDESLAYQNYSRNTNANSQATFAIEPAGAYKFRLTLDGYQHFSQTVASTTTAFDFVLPEQTQITFLDGETPIANKTIYVFRPDGTYFNFSRNTDANGVARFTLPLDNQYKFRVDVNGEQYFTPVYAGPGQYSFNIDPTANFPDLSFVSAGQSLLESSGFVSIPLTLSQTATELVSATIAISGNAQSADYQLFTTTVFITPGNNSEIVAFALENDFIDEEDQQVILSLTNLQNANAGAIQTHTIVILDDDLPPSLSFSPSNLAAEEDNTQVTIFYTLSNQSEKTVSFNYSVSGSAQSTDHDLVDGSLSIAPYQSTTSLTFNIIEDSDVEGLETVEVSIALANNANFDPASKFVYTILEDDAFDGVSITLASDQFFYKEENGTYQIPVGLNKAATTVVSADVSLILSNASSSDISLITSSITFEAGSTGALVEVSIPKDFVDEPVEQAFLSLQNIQNTNQGLYTQSVINILDIDPKPVLEFTSLSFSGSETEANAAVNLMITGETERYITFSYATMAPSVSDATVSTFETITLAPGTQSYQIPFTVSDDSIKEADEIVAFYLHRTTNAVIGRKNYTFYSILDDDRDDLDTITLDFAVTFEGVDNSEAVTMVVQDAQSKALVLIDEDVLANRQVVLPRTAEGYLITFVKVYQQAPRVKTYEAVTNSASFNVDFTIAGDAGGYITLLRNSVPVDREELTLMYLFDESFQVVDFKINTLGPLYRFPDRFGNFYVAIDDAPNFLIKPKATFPTDPLLFNVGDPIKVKVVRPDGIPLINHPIQYFPTDAQEFVQVGYTDENGEFTFASLVDQRYIALSNLGEGPVQSLLLAPGDTYDFFKEVIENPVETRIKVFSGGEPFGAALIVDYFNDSWESLGLTTTVDPATSFTILPRAEGLFHLGFADGDGNLFLSPQYLFPRGDIEFDIGGYITVTVRDYEGLKEGTKVVYYSESDPDFRQEAFTNAEGFVEFLTLSDTNYFVEAHFESEVQTSPALVSNDLFEFIAPVEGVSLSTFVITQSQQPLLESINVTLLDLSLQTTGFTTSTTNSVASIDGATGEFYVYIQTNSGSLLFKDVVDLPLSDYPIDLGGVIEISVNDGEFALVNHPIEYHVEGFPNFKFPLLTNNEGFAYAPTVLSHQYIFSTTIGFLNEQTDPLVSGDTHEFRKEFIEGRESLIRLFDDSSNPLVNTTFVLLDSNDLAVYQGSSDSNGKSFVIDLLGNFKLQIQTAQGIAISDSFTLPNEDVALTLGSPVTVKVFDRNGPVSAAVTFTVDDRVVIVPTGSLGDASLPVFASQEADASILVNGFEDTVNGLRSSESHDFDLSPFSYLRVTENGIPVTDSKVISVFDSQNNLVVSDAFVSSLSQLIRLSLSGLYSVEFIHDSQPVRSPLFQFPNDLVNVDIGTSVVIEVQSQSGPVANQDLEYYYTDNPSLTRSIQTGLDGLATIPILSSQTVQITLKSDNGDRVAPLLGAGSAYTFNPLPVKSVVMIRNGLPDGGKIIELLDTNFSLTSIQAQANASGIASFVSVNGNYHISFLEQGQRLVTELVDFPGVLNQFEVFLGDPINIQVNDLSAPLPNKEVRCYREDLSNYVLTANTDTNGQVSFPSLLGTNYICETDRSFGIQKSPTLQSSQSHVFGLDSQVQVLDQTGVYSTVLGIQMIDAGDNVVSSAFTQAPNYIASFNDLNGDLRVSFNINGFELRSTNYSFPSTFTQVQMGQSIQLQVNGSSGPLANAFVEVYSESDPDFFQTLQTDVNGQLAFPSLIDQAYKAKVSRSYGVQESISLVSGDIYVFEFTPVSLVSLQGESGGIQNREIRLLDVGFNDTSITANTGTSSTASLVGVTGSFYISFLENSFRVISKLIQLPQSQIDLQLGPDVTIEVLENNTPQENVSVSLYRSDTPGYLLNSTTDSQGLVSFPVLNGVIYEAYATRIWGNEISEPFGAGTFNTLDGLYSKVVLTNNSSLLPSVQNLSLLASNFNFTGIALTSNTSSTAILRDYNQPGYLLWELGDSDVMSQQFSFPNPNLGMDLGNPIQIHVVQLGVNQAGVKVEYYSTVNPSFIQTATADASGVVTFNTLSNQSYEALIHLTQGVYKTTVLNPGDSYQTPDVPFQQVLILDGGVPIALDTEVRLITTDLQRDGKSRFSDATGTVYWLDKSGNYRLQIKKDGVDYITPEVQFQNSFLVFDIQNTNDFEPPGFWQPPIISSHSLEAFSKVYIAREVDFEISLVDGSFVSSYHKSLNGSEITTTAISNKINFTLPIYYGSRNYEVVVSKGYENHTTLTLNLEGLTNCPNLTDFTPSSGSSITSGSFDISFSVDGYVPSFLLYYYENQKVSSTDFSRDTTRITFSGIDTTLRANLGYIIQVGGRCDTKLSYNLDFSGSDLDFVITKQTNLSFTPIKLPYQNFIRFPELEFSTNLPGVFRWEVFVIHPETLQRDIFFRGNKSLNTQGNYKVNIYNNDSDYSHHFYYHTQEYDVELKFDTTSEGPTTTTTTSFTVTF